MVSFEEVESSPPPAVEEKKEETTASILPASQERLLDAEAIEAAAKSIPRVSARMHVESLVKKLRKESEALKRVEASKVKMGKENVMTGKTETVGTMDSRVSMAKAKDAKKPKVSQFCADRKWFNLLFY